MEAVRECCELTSLVLCTVGYGVKEGDVDVFGSCRHYDNMMMSGMKLRHKIVQLRLFIKLHKVKVERMVKVIGIGCLL